MIRGLAGRAATLWLVSLAVVTAVEAEPREYVVDPGRSQIRFLAFSNITNVYGSFARFGGEAHADDAKPEKVDAQVVVDVNSLYTGNVMRDWHLRGRDFFAVGQFPTATFLATAIEPRGDQFELTGNLTIKGVTKPITMPVAVTRSPDLIRVVGETTLNRWEFAINYRSWMLPVADEARLYIDLTWVPKP